MLISHRIISQTQHSNSWPGTILHIWRDLSRNKTTTSSGKWYWRRSVSGPFFTLFCITLILSACGGLSGEPDIVATIPVETTPISTDLGYPEMPPDLALGAQIFASNCTRCHGVEGRGDGELVQSGEISSPGDFTDPAFSANKDPLEYFDIITNGRLENLMPPWGASLTEHERWAVTMYTYMLPYSNDQVAAGHALYETECGRCHGEEGRGDGPDAIAEGREPGDLSDPRNMISLRNYNIRVNVVEGAGTEMPAFGDDLTDEQVDNLIAYVRTLALAQPTLPEFSTVAQQPTVQSAQPAVILSEDGRITGRVMNATAGTTVPADLTVILHIVNPDLSEQTTEAAVAPDGTYNFEDVPVIADAIYFVSAHYQGRNFASSFYTMDRANTRIDAPITLYEATADDSVIRLTSVVIQLSAVGEIMQFDQEMVFSNTSDRMYITDLALDAQRRTSLTIPLPVGAVVVGGEQSRYAFDADTFTLYDTLAVLPETDHVVNTTYLIPYQRGAIIEFPTNYTLNGVVILLPDGEELRIESEQLRLVDREAVPTLQRNAYAANLNLNPGELIRFEVLGSGQSIGTSADRSLITADKLLPVLLFAGIIIIVAITVPVVISRRRTTPESRKNQLIDQLARQIAELDAQHDQGQVNHDLYHHQRRELKQQLSQLVEREDGE